MSSSEDILDAVLDRIHVMFDLVNPETWTVSEAAAVLDVLAGIAAAREGRRQVVDW